MVKKLANLGLDYDYGNRGGNLVRVVDDRENSRLDTDASTTNIEMTDRSFPGDDIEENEIEDDMPKEEDHDPDAYEI